ncbi:hypothetical protein AB1K70_23345 [Bremerella sp. JC770]|uniref:hypothetical protein n=1 Tax=Bremerella sp. JC770 TaxID=3232137 RepID=UPI00345A6087
MNVSNVFPFLLAITICCSSIACSDSEGRRYSVKGIVSFQGQPVPSGNIVFEPNADKGESGRACMAMIHNGEYAVSADGGVLPHSYHVRVTGYSGGSRDSGASGGDVKELFPEYVTENTFDPENAVLDIEVPAKK